MFTQKRFTPDLLERYKSLGRGLGIYESYVPWHRVSRSDPSSIGRSHLQMWRGRQRELLSDLEWIIFLFLTMIPQIVDCREQFPLSVENAPHEMNAYLPQKTWPVFLGTNAIAKQLGLKHPIVRDKKRSAEWVMTTDFLIVVPQPEGTFEFLAIAVKPDEFNKHKRTKELLKIEQQYWYERGVQWLLLTPPLWDRLVGDSLRQSMPWALGDTVGEAILAQVENFQNIWRGRSVAYALNQLTAKLGDSDLAQRAFWQTAWTGRMCIDFRRGWRPHEPISILSPSEFWSLNPVVSRRSAWTN